MNVVKVKIEELIGLALDWAVAKSEGMHVTILEPCKFEKLHAEGELCFSINPVQAHPIIDRECINLRHESFDHKAKTGPYCKSASIIDNHDGIVNKEQFGPTLLVAAMRCYVSSKLGQEIEVPEKLLPAEIN